LPSKKTGVQLEIAPVKTPADWREFHRLPYRVYAGDPNWIAPLLLERKFHFDPKHNPFFEHAEAAFWLARQGGEAVGRISAQVDALHLERYRDATGHFGFIEAIDDSSVFGSLLGAAEAWLKQKGMRRALGPVSFSMWDQPGVLVEGFDTPASVMMGYARPYFGPRISEARYVVAQDLIAYDYTRDMVLPPVIEQTLLRAQRRGELTFRDMRTGSRDVAGEVALMLDIVNDAWSDNWGFVPMTKEEGADMASMLKWVLKPKDVVIAEYKGEPMAFVMTIPDLNDAARDLNGRLLPFGWIKLLWRLKVQGIRKVRMALMGVRKSLQTSPLGAALAFGVIKKVRDYHEARGATNGELSWVLDHNENVKHLIELTGATPYKRYRIFEKRLI
jgi:hypothetical protein